QVGAEIVGRDLARIAPKRHRRDLRVVRHPTGQHAHHQRSPPHHKTEIATPGGTPWPALSTPHWSSLRPDRRICKPNPHSARSARNRLHVRASTQNAAVRRG